MKTPALIALLCLFFSCSKKEEKLPNPVLDCIGTVSTSIFQSNCEDFGPVTELCKIEQVGNFSIEDSSKVYMPQFCKEKGDLVVFQNGAGDKITMELTGKLYDSQVITYYSNIMCQTDSTKTIGICIENENLSIRMKAIDADLDLIIEISTIPDFEKSSIGQVSDILRILRVESANSYIIDFRAVLDQRTSSHANTFNQQFFEDITLLGKNYKDVISNDKTHFDNPYTYFYNKQAGLIAFSDPSGTMWRIID